MKRVAVLGVLLVVGGLSVSLAAVQRAGGAPGPMVIEVEKVRDNLFVLRGGGGNTAVFVQSNGVTVVDTKNPILAEIKRLTNRPVTTIINTHTHGDHVSGNVAFAEKVQVIVQANTRDNMEKMKIFPENKGRGLPTRVFADYMELGTGNDRMELHYFGRGHTNGDAWVLFPALRVVHAGDIFPGKQMPILDGNNGGSGFEMPRTLSKAHTMFSGADAIITGHSTVMKPSDLREWADFNDEFLIAVRQAKAAGQTVDQFVSTYKVPARFASAGYAQPQEARLRANTELVWKELR
jgi:cyclase